MQNNHVDDLVDAYALGALEPDEVDAVERHLEECAACRALAEEARRNAQLLLYAAPPAQPPASLRGRVLARIVEEKAAMATGHAIPSGGSTPAPEANPEPARGPFRRLLQALRNEPATADDTGLALRDLLADPQVEIWPVSGTNDAPGASARLVTSPRQRDGVLIASGLRRPTTGMTYQIWLLRGGQPLPNALFTVNRAGVGAGIVHADKPWRDFETVAVTPEPTSGSPAPTGPIVLAGSLATRTN